MEPRQLPLNGYAPRADLRARIGQGKWVWDGRHDRGAATAPLQNAECVVCAWMGPDMGEGISPALIYQQANAR